MNTVINSFINTVKKIKSEIFGKISDFIFLHVEKIKSEIFWKISDFIFLYAEKIKSEIFVPFGHRTFVINGRRLAVMQSRSSVEHKIRL